MPEFKFLDGRSGFYSAVIDGKTNSNKPGLRSRLTELMKAHPPPTGGGREVEQSAVEAIGVEGEEEAAEAEEEAAQQADDEADGELEEDEGASSGDGYGDDVTVGGGMGHSAGH